LNSAADIRQAKGVKRLVVCPRGLNNVLVSGIGKDWLVLFMFAVESTGKQTSHLQFAS
jgi:hypothetical protein